MKILKKIGIWSLAIITVLVITIGSFIYSLRPEYNGEKELLYLNAQVKVYYDDYGVPHIYGDNERDAFRALGYVHAQDRLWQMELLRRIAAGELSEVFGKDLIGTDKFFLSIGIDDASAQTVAQIDQNSEAVQLAGAYLDGINQFIAEGPTPIEFYLTGIEKKDFTLKDIYNTMGYMAFSFAMAHKTDPLLTNIKDKLGPEYLKDLAVFSDAETEKIKNYTPIPTDTLGNSIPTDTLGNSIPTDTLGNSITAVVADALRKLDLPLFQGSNSWVLAPEKTKNGKVIFANDPHIGFSQPSVWYEAHLETPAYSKYGYHIAGIPFPILGHNRKLAYGMTMFENDDVDFYYEETNPKNENQYKTDQGWKSYETVTKKIKVKDSDTVSFSFKKTLRGPVLNGIANQITGERPVAMTWVYTQMENKVIDALFEMAHAENLTEFKMALPKVHAPGLNIMYGDARGNIAWFATAQLYEIPDSVSTKLIFDRGEDFPIARKLLDFSENPQAINPPWRYVYSANNQPDSIAGMLYPGYYLPENRAKRIVALLEPKDDWGILDVQEMMTDVTSTVNRDVVADLSKLLEVSKLNDKELKTLDALASWKGDYPLDSCEAVIFSRWMYYFLEHTFKDELGGEQFEQFLETHFHKRLIAPLVQRPNSVWWDNVTTPGTVETRTQIVSEAFSRTMKSLEEDFGADTDQWTWDKVHTLEHPHPIGQVATLRSFFNVGPFPVHGTREVINNMYFDYNAKGFYETVTGPSTRRVVDFSDVENSMSILPTGQSGNPLSKYYKDQAELYVQGKFRKMMMNREEIQKSKEILIFSPKSK
ncbi:penicillin acylase family protein [Maribacter sp. 2304DJ31-5]|uniref:penicillin acylase family protein n=1 Tax=Maribacter sp. 2304DJ31-5 TaxID=3386273 RepID=UPI0039BCB4E2